MLVPSFEIRDKRSICFAKCETVPRLMIIAGPNGTGKSTLLHNIRSSNEWNIIYLGPHRAMRRQQVQHRHLISTRFGLEELLMRRDVPSHEGVQLVTGSRDPWSYDDSVNYLKHTLCQIHIDFQAAISDRYQRDGEIKRDSIADPWKPLRELCANLLPHLHFAGIDSKNRDRMQCLWNVHRTGQAIDLDDLSSGEKSIIQMFFPLVEREIRSILEQVSNEKTMPPRPEQCILIDEPELHLHPNLQVKVLDYLRVLTAGTQTQVILATHSPTIVESASFEELFLLRPVELVSSGENQLVQVATDEERLQTLKTLFGNTSNLTSMQTIVVVEGVREQDTRRVSCDRKLYRALHPGFDHVTIVPGGGKSECRALLRTLGETMRSFSSQLRTVALLDRDYSPDGENGDGSLFFLPVSMIENFLIDPDALWTAIQSVIEKTAFGSAPDIANALSLIMDAHEQEEISRRAVNKLGAETFRASRPLEQLPEKATAFCAKIQTQFSSSSVNEALGEAKSEVQHLKRVDRRREEFHGKEVLQKFFSQYLHSSPLSKVVFSFETARHARNRKTVKSFFDYFFSEVNPQWALPSASPLGPKTTAADH